MILRGLRLTRRSLPALLHDAVMAAASFVLAVSLRLGADHMDQAAPYLARGTILFTIVCVSVFLSMRLYRGLWRYVSIRDVTTIARAVTLSILIFAVAMFLIDRLHTMPRSVLVINWLLLMFMLTAPRFAWRMFNERTVSWSAAPEASGRIPVLLIGAGNRAELFIRDMNRNPGAPYEAVAIADDDPRQKDRTIHHVPIYGSTEILPTIVRKMERKGRRPQKIILADDKASGDDIRRLLDLADGLGIPLARLPRSSDFRTEFGKKHDVRPIAVEDLLGRAQNVLDRDSMRALIRDRRVLVTGAGGTIGAELVRQIAACAPESLVLLELSEFNLYNIEREIRAALPGLLLTPVLCDVRNAQHVGNVFDRHRPELVFHAAAIKHVPLSEANIEEAVLTNVFGTRNVADACRKHATEAMVFISTDKAVNPANVMGATKRLAENFCQAQGGFLHGADATRFITVRFGNVLGSTGSVVPLFQEQLAKGGPITVTHPEMTRYFMTVREAVELVLQAAALGHAMERQEYIFVLDMGQPVKILDLARQMIRLAGLRPEEDIEIVFTGPRPGEKLYEELFHFSENAAKTSHESIFLASPRFADMGAIHKSLERLMSACQARNAEEARRLLNELVPEFKSALAA